MRSNPVRFVLGLRCTFIYHHTLCLQIVVALLSLCICAGSLKHSLSAHVQKATVNLEPVLGRSAKDLANLYTYEQSHKSLRAAWERIYCKYFKHVCETALVFGVPVQKMRGLQRLLRCLSSFENVSHEQ